MYIHPPLDFIFCNVLQLFIDILILYEKDELLFYAIDDLKNPRLIGSHRVTFKLVCALTIFDQSDCNKNLILRLV